MVDIGNDPPPPGGEGRVEFDPGSRNVTPVALRRSLSFIMRNCTVQTYDNLCKRCNTQQQAGYTLWCPCFLTANYDKTIKDLYDYTILKRSGSGYPTIAIF